MREHSANEPANSYHYEAAERLLLLFFFFRLVGFVLFQIFPFSKLYFWEYGRYCHENGWGEGGRNCLFSGWAIINIPLPFFGYYFAMCCFLCASSCSFSSLHLIDYLYFDHGIGHVVFNKLIWLFVGKYDTFFFRYVSREFRCRSFINANTLTIAWTIIAVLLIAANTQNLISLELMQIDESSN